MKLRAVELHGYKSFAAKSALQFDAPVTAIVGPNGSGKSNVMDALRWAIGAGAGRSLRTKRNEDVVFSGGRDRAPAGFADVRVLLDNSDRWLEFDAAEVEIVRRVHRDGQSEVRINGRSARLRDVQDLFRSTGLAAGGFALMSQGLVDEILQLRPHERRQAIEEVAGVRQHRHQMNESRRRRERAQEHLTRARLLRDELAPRLRSLERAARRARRRSDLQRQLDEVQSTYFLSASQELEARRHRLGDEASSAAAARSLAERHWEQTRSALAAVERNTTIARGTVETTAEALRSARSELRTLEHQQELDQQQRSWLQREVQELSARLQVERRHTLSFNLDDAKQQLADINSRLNDARTNQRNLERIHAKSAAGHERALSELTTIETLAQTIVRRWRANHASLRLSANDEQAALRNHDLALAERSRLQTTLVDHERALAAARERSEARAAHRSQLKRRLDQVHTEILAIEEADRHPDTMQALIRSRTTDPNRADAIFGELMDAALFDDLEQAIAHIEQSIEADVGRATGVLRDQAVNLIDSMIAQVDFVDTTEAAKQRAREGHAAVTPHGLVIRPDGVLLAGGSQPGVRRLRARLNALNAEQADLSSQLQQVDQHDRDKHAIDERSQAASKINERLTIQRHVVDDTQRALDETKRRHTTASEQRRSLRVEVDRLRSQLRQARTDEQHAREFLISSQPPMHEDLSHLEEERDRLAANLAEARAQSAAQERTRADRARLRSLRRDLEHVNQQIQERAPRLQAATAAASDTGTHELAQEHLHILEQKRAEAAQDLERAQQARVSAEREDVQAAAALQEARSALERLATEAAAEGISLESLRRGPNHALQPSMELNGTNGANGTNGSGPRGSRDQTVGTLQRTVAPTGTATIDHPSSSELKQQVDDLRGKLQRIGPADPAAASEYTSEQQRWRSVEAQIADLESTESALKDAEHDLETLIEQKFREACQQVDRAFGHYFQTMFRGGQASLVLSREQPTSDEDLESTAEALLDRPKLGVDIRAQPPGKRVSSLNLLSGGERALTAIALLFAFLEVRPAPFCVLDEVDAALDEANVERFVAALKERARETQFVIITHNRRTIEQADSIYGVTMGAAGVSRLLSVRVNELGSLNSSANPNPVPEPVAVTVVR